MKELTLDVQLRNEIGSRKIKKIRHNNFVPAVIYGGKKQGSTVVMVNRGAYESVMRHHRGQSVIFHLNVMEGEKKLRDYSAIVKQAQVDPVHDHLLHLDFQSISLTELIEVRVQIVTRGEPIGVKQDGGSLDHAMWELDVVCLPTNIPEKIEVAVEHLKIGDTIHVSDLVLPEGVKTKHDGKLIVLSVVPPMKEEVVAPEAQITEPEVIREKKDKEGKEAPAEKAEEKPQEKKEDKSREKAKEKPDKKA